MQTFKEIFEKSYGEGSFNDEFLIHALSAEHLAKQYALSLSEPYGYVFEGRFFKTINELNRQTFFEQNEPIPVYLKGVLHSPDTDSKNK